jgi:hypothetical protein
MIRSPIRARGAESQRLRFRQNGQGSRGGFLTSRERELWFLCLLFRFASPSGQFLFLRFVSLSHVLHREVEQSGQRGGGYPETNANDWEKDRREAIHIVLKVRVVYVFGIDPA